MVKRQSQYKVPSPFVLVVFGASGDLTSRKLIPAVFDLYCKGLLPTGTSVVGFARSEKTDQDFRDHLRESSKATLSCDGKPITDDQWEQFASHLFYQQGNYDNPDDFATLKESLAKLCQNNSIPENFLFYLATPSSSFVPIVSSLEKSGLSRKGAMAEPWTRVVVEKPFGHDLQSAKELTEEIRQAFGENQIFRIDHYLGKETVQNILVLRFANSIFEHIWSHDYIDHFQITVSETLGVGSRGGYYDQSGAIRDMLQNHMMHLLCLVAMEPPIALDAESIRSEKVKVLQALRPIPFECANNGVIRAQYSKGHVDGQAVPGYLEEDNVDPYSTTETFVAFKANVDNWRWAGVPFYLKTGKRLAQKSTEISVHFNSVPQVLFNNPPRLEKNVLVIRVQPDEGISLTFQVKEPGPSMNIRPLKMEFDYEDSFGAASPNAYERLLLDAALGDATLFPRSDEVEAAWQYLTPVIEGCASQCACSLPQYPSGSWGPREADALISADGNFWNQR